VPFLATPTSPAAQFNPVEMCISAIGMPSADSSPWSAVVTLRVAPDRYASEISFDAEGLKHANYLVFGVLPKLRFRKSCIGDKIHVPITWQASKDGPGVMFLTGGIVLSGRVRSTTRRPWGSLTLGDRDIEALRRTPSVREFVRSKGLNPDY
jgi:hypothetical protein